MNKTLRFTIARCFMVVVMSGMAWRMVRLFVNFDMSGDEANVLLDIWTRTYGQLVNPLNFSQVLPPAFLWLTKALDSLFPNEWGVRLCPALAGFAGVFLFWKLCLEVLHGTARWVAWAVFSVSYVPVAEGACVKGYTIDLLVAMVMLWWMLRWLRHGQNARELAWLALCAPVFIWLSYTSVFVIGAISLVFIGYCVRERSRMDRRSLVAGFVFMALAGASAIALYEINIRPSEEMSQASGLQGFWDLGYPPLHHPWRIPLWLVEVHAGRGFAWPVGDNNYRSILTAVLWLAGLIAYWRRGNKSVWALLILPQLLLLIAAFLHKYPYGANPRICMFLGPGVCLFMGAGLQNLLDRAGRERRHLGYRVAAFLLLCIPIAGAARDVVLRIREIKGPDIRSTLTAASQVVGPAGHFVILPGPTSGILAYYLKRYVTQPISKAADISPAQVHSGSTVAALAATGERGGVRADLFDGFEKQLGKPMTLLWAQVAQIQPTNKEGEVIVRIYGVGDAR